MATPIKLQGAETFEISVIEHNLPYTKGERAKAGKTYSRFKFEGTAFAVPSDNPFVADFIAGNVKSVKLMDTEREVEQADADGVVTMSKVRSIDLDSYISKAQWNSLQDDSVKDAEVAYKIGRYKALETAPVTEDLLAQLQNA
jgi:hypothetical protein